MLNNLELKEEILKLKKELNVSIVAHFYQKDEVFELADYAGDSLQLAQWAAKDANPYLVFCGVGFMGQSVKILAPEKRVFMPRIACCAMARMIDVDYFDQNVAILEKAGIAKEDISKIFSKLNLTMASGAVFGGAIIALLNNYMSKNNLNEQE